jgi:D-alanyl-D-alanine carboxypeptidase/D-alanyl-D-alanine-endopeptidase (penicillin-binding protein 4)
MLKLLPGLRQFFWLWCFFPLSPTLALCRQDLAPAIEAIIQRPEWERSHWGVLIQSLSPSPPLYSLNADKFFIPASTTKLLSSAAALLALTPNFRFRTPVYLEGEPPRLQSLHLVGTGDPSLTSRQLEQLAQQLKARGIRQIEQLFLVDSFLNEINPTWEWEDIFFSYGVNAQALILNENTVTLTLFPQAVGQPLGLLWSDAIAAQQWGIDNQTSTISNPPSQALEIRGILGEPMLIIRGQLSVNSAPDSWELRVINSKKYFLESFKTILNKEGIQVNLARIINNPKSAIFAETNLFIESKPIAELIKKVNQDSHNLYAESLFRNPEEIRTHLTKLGVNAAGYKLVDASGLSRHNLLTPTTLVEILRLMQGTPYAEIYKNSLAVAGESGTLQNRFQDTPVKGKLWGKTGTLSGVVALAGYLEGENQENFVFSIMVNNSEQPASKIRSNIDEIILQVFQAKSCVSRKG